MKEQIKSIKKEGKINLTLSTGKKWKGDKAELLDACEAITAKYMEQNLSLSLRQLYYQLVTTNAIPNDEKTYKKLSEVVVEGRLGGYIDWRAIVDRGRRVKHTYTVDDVADAVEDTICQYRLDRQKGQPNYIEVCVEKDALSEVLGRVTGKYHLRFMVNKGYSSITAIYDAYNRYKYRIQDGQKVKLIYLGDHDPSGLDMIRDIYDRISGMLLAAEEDYDYDYRDKMLKTLGFNDLDELYERYPDEHWEDLNEADPSWKYYEFPEKWLDDDGRQDIMVFNWVKYAIDNMFEVIPIALTMEQIEQYNPPPNPAKITDSRAKEYIEKYGEESWELDALDPTILRDILTAKVEELVDMPLYNSVIDQEAKDKAYLRNMAANRDKHDGEDSDLEKGEETPEE